MNTFVEAEAERRSQNKTKTLLPAEIASDEGMCPVQLLELREHACRALMEAESLGRDVDLRIPLPSQETVSLTARVAWSKSLGGRQLHVGLDEFRFASPRDKQSLLSYLNEVLVESEELGVKALRQLGSQELRRLSRLVRSSRALNPCQSYHAAIEQVLDLTRRALGAERGLFLVSRGEEQMAVEVARGSSAIKERGLAFSRTVADTVAESGKPLLSLDTRTDEILGAASSLTMLGTVSVMCVPLRTKSRNFGYIYVDNSVKRGLFRDSDLALATIIADLAAASMEKNINHLVIRQAERVEASKNLVATFSKELLPGLKAILESSKTANVAFIESKSKQAVALLEGLLQLSSDTPKTRDSTDLMDVLEDLAMDLEEVAFPLPPEAGWPKIAMPNAQLEELILNLVSVARQDESQELAIEVAADESLFRLFVRSPKVNMSSREIRRLFMPLSGTKFHHAQVLVHDAGGLIRVHPEPSGGTVMTVELPLSSEH